MIFKSGKYKDWTYEDVAQKNPGYLKFLLTLNPTSQMINEIRRVLGKPRKVEAISKIESRITEALLARGYSLGESDQMLRRIKDK